MRKTIPILCFLAAGLAGCAKQDPTLRAREQRAYPDPTKGTDNSESQWYRTQTIAAPSAATTGGTSDTTTPQTNAPARQLKKPVPVRQGTPVANPAGVPIAR